MFALVALSRTEQTVLKVNFYIELVGRAQMTDKDGAQVAPGSFFFSEATALQEAE